MFSINESGDAVCIVFLDHFGQPRSIFLDVVDQNHDGDDRQNENDYCIRNILVDAPQYDAEQLEDIEEIENFFVKYFDDAWNFDNDLVSSENFTRFCDVIARSNSLSFIDEVTRGGDL